MEKWKRERSAGRLSMLRRMLPVAMAAGVMLLAAGAGCASPEDAEYDLPSPDRELAMRDAGKPVRIRTGEYVLITLKENPTTGYIWYFKVSPTPETPARRTDEAVELAGERYVAPAASVPGEPVKVGVGGVKQLMVRAVRPGRAYVLCHCRRGWESDKPAAEAMFIFDVY